MNEHVMADEQTAGVEAAKAPVLYLNAIQRRYQQGEAELTILRGAELGCWLGQSIALIAPSGAGKSTLLHIAGLLEHPDGGEVFIDGKPTSGLSDAERTADPPGRNGLRLSGASSAAGILRGRERDDAADDPRACRAPRRTSAQANFSPISG